MVTDGSKSYAVFTYQCGGLTSQTNGTIGFNADGSFYSNYPLSGTNTVLKVACVNSPMTVWNNLIYPLTQSLGIMNCLLQA